MAGSGLGLAAPDLGTEIERFLRFRARLTAHLRRVEELLHAWDVWDVQRCLPLGARTLYQQPESDRATLNELRHALADSLRDLDRGAAM